MALKLYERYPQLWESPSNDYPQGAFKNLSAQGETDGSYLEKDWLNDYSGFFGALLENAQMTPNGTIDTAQRSQFYEALVKVAKSAVDLSAYRKKDDLLFKGMFKVQATDDVAAGVFLQDTDGTVRGQVVATDQGLQLTQYPKDGGLQTFTFPSDGGEIAILENINSSLLEQFTYLEDVRNSNVDTAFILVGYHSEERKVGGGLYRRSLSHKEDNNGSIVISLNGVTYESMFRGNYVETFGLQGFGSVDNSDYFENMLTYYEKVSYHSRTIYFGNGIYNISRPVHIPNKLTNLQLVGTTRTMASRLVYTGEDLPEGLFNVEAEMFSVNNMRITYLNRRPQQGQVAMVGFNFFREKGGTVDIDATIDNCHIGGFNYAVQHKGRGLWVKNSTVAICYGVANLDFPNEADIELTPGGPISSSYDHAWRGIRFTNCRFHSIQSQAIHNTGENSEMLNGLEVNGILMDLGNGLFNGHLGTSSRITACTLSNSSDYTSMYITGGIGFVVDGVVLHNSSKRTKPDNAIYVSGKVIGSISDITTNGTKSHAIRMSLAEGSDVTLDNINCIDVGETPASSFGVFVASTSKSRVILSNISVPENVRSPVGLRSIDADTSLEFSELYGGDARSVTVLDSSPVGATGFGKKGNNFIPYTQGNLGNSNLPFTDIYLLNNPTVTSDAKAKFDIEDIDEKYMRVMSILKFKQFKLKEGTSGRTHFGIIAQEWIKACKDCGIDPYESGVLVGDEKTGYAIRYNELQILFNAYILHKLRL